MGGVLGGLLLLGLIFFLCRRRRTIVKSAFPFAFNSTDSVSLPHTLAEVTGHESFFSPGAAYEEYPPSPTFNVRYLRARLLW